MTSLLKENCPGRGGVALQKLLTPLCYHKTYHPWSWYEDLEVEAFWRRIYSIFHLEWMQALAMMLKGVTR